jgi:hypothetical protein
MRKDKFCDAVYDFAIAQKNGIVTVDDALYLLREKFDFRGNRSKLCFILNKRSNGWLEVSKDISNGLFGSVNKRASVRAHCTGVAVQCVRSVFYVMLLA